MMRSKHSLSRRRSLSDPLSKALQPPPDESPAARERRIKREAEAKKKSDDIDELIRHDRAAMKKQRPAVKILLLGQSESGKSTTLKQFQLLHAPAAFYAERTAWRTVIYLNLIRSIRRILEALIPPQAPDPSSSSSTGASTSTAAPRSGYPFHYDESSAADVERETWRESGERPSTSTSSTLLRFEKYARQLAPLLALEQRLMRQLSYPDEDDPGPNVTSAPGTLDVSLDDDDYANAAFPTSTVQGTRQPRAWNSAAPPLPEPTNGSAYAGTYAAGYNTAPLKFGGTNSGLTHSRSLNGSATLSHSASSSRLAHSYSASSSTPTTPTHTLLPPPTTPTGELAVPTTSTWKQSLSLSSLSGRSGRLNKTKNTHTGEVSGWWEDPDDPVHTIYACAHMRWGMAELWRDESVRRVLERRRVRMEESSGFYLNEIERIAAHRYIPTDDDVLKARLKTIGVVEHTFTVKNSSAGPSLSSNSSTSGSEWKIYDVGGARNQRQAWAPYFEDVNAIIFLAPISAFDQTLAEDPRVNRLEDSMLLWRSLVSQKLLGAVNIILFLNKCDLLKAKLEAGVSLGYHMPSYGNRLNDYESVSKYFRNKFGALHQSHTPNKDRELYIHLTSVTDKLKTAIIISNVRDIILKNNLQSSRLI